jgi:hypothetical protein
MVSPADSSLAAIRKKIRRLTASAGESSLRTDDIDNYINVYYSQDFPYSVKMDQMRSVYAFFTEPHRDKYPIDVNYIQGVRAPFYVDGIQGTFFKDRRQFHNVWPKFPTRFAPAGGDGVETVFAFTLPGPFLAGEVTLGCVDSFGNPISVADDGLGNLQLQVPNPQVSVPPQFEGSLGVLPLPPAIPGMKNKNTENPGLINVNTQTLIDPLVPGVFYPGGIGTVDYVTGEFNLTFPVPPGNGSEIVVKVSQYQPGRPYSLLFWNNELTIRPIPDEIHKVEVEIYLTPTQFLAATDTPILDQWWQLLALGSSVKILEDRQDMEGVENLMRLFEKQEGIVLERQGVEELFVPNYTIFNSSYPAYGGVNGIGYFS